MKKYSVHLCGYEKNSGEYHPECIDVDVHAETEELALTYAFARHEEFPAAHVQSVWDMERDDWRDYVEPIRRKR